MRSQTTGCPAQDVSPTAQGLGFQGGAHLCRLAAVGVACTLVERGRQSAGQQSNHSPRRAASGCANEDLRPQADQRGRPAMSPGDEGVATCKPAARDSDEIRLVWCVPSFIHSARVDETNRQVRRACAQLWDRAGDKVSGALPLGLPSLLGVSPAWRCRETMQGTRVL